MSGYEASSLRTANLQDYCLLAIAGWSMYGHPVALARSVSAD